MPEDSPDSKRLLRDRYQRLKNEKWLREKPQRSAALVRRNQELSERWRHLQQHGTGKPLLHPRSEYWTIEEVADRKNTSERVVKEAIRMGWLPAEKPGKLWLIHRDSLDCWKKTQRRGPGHAWLLNKRCWEE